VSASIDDVIRAGLGILFDDDPRTVSRSLENLVKVFRLPLSCPSVSERLCFVCRRVVDEDAIRPLKPEYDSERSSFCVCKMAGVERDWNWAKPPGRLVGSAPFLGSSIIDQQRSPIPGIFKDQGIN